MIGILESRIMLVYGRTWMLFTIFLPKSYKLLKLWLLVILKSRITLLIGYYYYPRVEDKSVEI